VYQQVHRISVTKDKTDRHNASQINDEGLFEFLASEFLSELYLILLHNLDKYKKVLTAIE
jgi:hypothetical protein